MYKIYADNTLIYDSTVEDHKIGKGSITLEINKSGSFAFSIYPDHFYYDNFVKLKTVITVYKSNKIVFRGRILNDVTDYWNNKNITCEGELGFLQDSIIRPFSYTGSPEGLFKRVIEDHNAQVDEFKRFKIGNVTVINANGDIIRNSTDYSASLGILATAFTDSDLGGYIYITHGSDGTDPIPTINYLRDFTTVSSQNIEFGSNLKNYTKTVKAEDMATAIIPLGASIGENKRLTIESVNNGLDYIYSRAGVDEYGWIFKTVVWDNVTLAQDLKTRAEEYLNSIVNQNVTIELNAIDLHLLDRSIESFKVCDYVRVTSEPHNLDAVLLCNKQTMDILKPENDTVVLGYQSPTFTGNNSNMAASISSHANEISSIKQDTSSIKLTVENLDNDFQSAIEQTINEITLSVSNAGTSSTITLNYGETEISSQKIILSGVVTVSDLKNGTTTIDGGCIKTGTINANRLDLSGATISNGTIIDGTSIYSPKIYANEFSVLPESVTDEGSFNIWGYEGNHLFHVLQIKHDTSIAPYVSFSSPGAAEAFWAFEKTMFSGTLDFRGTTIVQPYFLVEEITSSSVKVVVYNVRPGDEITGVVRRFDNPTTISTTNISDDTIHGLYITGIKWSLNLVVGVKVNGNYIGFQPFTIPAS